MSDLGLRFGQPAEREQLEELQRRASLMHDAYREALLANPDLIALPRWQLEQNRVRVAEVDGRTLGFAAVLPRDGQTCNSGPPFSWNRTSGSGALAAP